MTRLRNVLLGLLLLAGFAYLGLKAYLYYEVKSSLDQAIAAARPVADIRYQGIESSLSGSVTVREVTVHAFGDEVRVDAVRVGTPDIVELLSTLSELQRGEPPEFLELELRQVDIQLGGPLMGFVQGALQSKAPRLPDSYPCDGQIVFGPAAWRAMGYERLRSDLRLRLDINGRNLRAEGAWQGADMGMLRFRTEVSGIQAAVDRMPTAAGGLLRSLEMDYQDRSYYRRWVRYCAGRDGIDPASFIDAVVNADATYYMYSWGVVPGGDLRRAYGEFLRNPVSVSVVARPGTPVELVTLDHYAPDAMVALLDLRVIVNGQGVESSQVSYRPELLGKFNAAPTGDWRLPLPQRPAEAAAVPEPARRPQAAAADQQSSRLRPSAPELPAAAPKSKVAAVAPAPAPAVKRTPEPVYDYRPVATDALGRYLGRYVRVFTSDGAAREGVLSAVRAGEVVVERRMYGGSMAVPMPLSGVDRIEVWLPKDS